MWLEMSDAPIVVVREGRLEPAELKRLVLLFFEDMVKYVVDVERGVVAVGGEMHADDGGNRSMEVQDAAVRARVRELTLALIGDGGPLPARECLRAGAAPRRPDRGGPDGARYAASSSAGASWPRPSISSRTSRSTASSSGHFFS